MLWEHKVSVNYHAQSKVGLCKLVIPNVTNL